MGKMDKDILCISKNKLDIFEEHILVKANNSVGIATTLSLWTKRGPAESDDSVLQIIPYVYLMDVERQNILIYTRTTSGGEGRLHNKISVGIGGHVDKETHVSHYGSRSEIEEDLVEYINLSSDAYREIKEEVGLRRKEISSLTHKYNIYITEPDVCKYHLGVVLEAITDVDTLLELSERPTDGEVIHSIVSLKELYKIYTDPNSNIEDWSKIVIKNILRTYYK